MFNTLCQISEGPFRVMNNAHVWTYFSCINMVFSILVGSLVICLGGGIIAFSAVVLASEIIRLILQALYLKVYYPDTCKLSSEFNFIELKKIFKAGFNFSTSSFGEIVKTQGSLLLSRAFLGAEKTAIISVVQKLTKVVYQIFMAINLSTTPIYQKYYHQGNFRKINILYVTTILICIALSAVSILSIHVCKDFLGEIFLQNNSSPGLDNLWMLLSLSSMPAAIWITSSSFLKATNEHRILAISSIVGGIVSFLVSIFLVRNLGLIGLALGLLSYDILVSSVLLKKSSNSISSLLNRAK